MYLIVNIMHNCSHSLRGLCGLKCHTLRNIKSVHMSQSARTVWIEIGYFMEIEEGTFSSQSARTVWIEIPKDILKH